VDIADAEVVNFFKLDDFSLWGGCPVCPGNASSAEHQEAWLCMMAWLGGARFSAGVLSLVRAEMECASVSAKIFAIWLKAGDRAT